MQKQNVVSAELTLAQVRDIMKALPKGERVVPILHVRPDDDELLTLRMVELWGRDVFPGVSRSPINVLDAGLRLTDGSSGNSWLPKYVCIGLGGGIFDEHGKGDGKSAASMAAEFFGVADDAALKPILAYSLRADDRAEDHPFNLATIIKNLHAAGVPLEKVRQMHARWVDSLYVMFGGRITISDKPRTTLRSMAIAWYIGKFGKPEHRKCVFGGEFREAMKAVEGDSDSDTVVCGNADAVREIQRFVDRDDAHGIYDFDLKGLVRAMQFTNVPDSIIMEDVAVILDSKVHIQRDFMAAHRLFREKASFVADSPLRIGVVRSDLEQMQKAARAADKQLAVLIQFRSTGHVQIFSDQQRDLRPIARRLRALEFSKSGRKGSLSFTELSGPGTLRQVPEWYAFEKYSKVIHIFNGSLKTKRTPKTRLTEKEVVQCVTEGLRQTHRARGVKRDKREQVPSAQQA